MNYKNLILSQDLRLKILSIMEFIPDRLMIKLQYYIKVGKVLNLKKPKRYSEKLQWYKLNYRNELMTKCVDKYRVREYVQDKGYSHILVDLYGVFNDAKDIEFEKLPNKFVLKTTNGSRTNIFCENKREIDIKEVTEKLNKWLHKRTVKAGREWAYYKVKPLIICEEYLEKDDDNDIVDYKFYCFNGKVEVIEICKERFSASGVRMGFFNRELKFIDINNDRYAFTDDNNNRLTVLKPGNFDEMINIAERLSEDFPHVRVDLYNIRGKIVFGELTFYSASGYVNYGEFDYILGEKFDINELK